MYVCVLICVHCVMSLRETTDREGKQSKAKQSTTRKKLYIDISMMKRKTYKFPLRVYVYVKYLMCVYVCVCMSEEKPTTENFRRGKIFYLFLISIICISSRHVCVHTFSEKIGKMRRIGVLGRCWRVTDHRSGVILWYAEERWIIHTISTHSLGPFFEYKFYATSTYSTHNKVH